MHFCKELSTVHVLFLLSNYLINGIHIIVICERLVSLLIESYFKTSTSFIEGCILWKIR